MLAFPDDNLPERRPSFPLTARLGRQLARATGEFTVRAEIDELADDLDDRRRRHQQRYVLEYTLAGMAGDDLAISAAETIEARHPGYLAALGARRLNARATADEQILGEMISAFRTRHE